MRTYSTPTIVTNKLSLLRLRLLYSKHFVYGIMDRVPFQSCLRLLD